MTPDKNAWIAAGGNADRLALYESIGTVAPFSDGEDRCLATVHPAQPHVGMVGDWVGGDEVRLAAEAWLHDRGCRVLRGPMEMSTWLPPWRANLGPFDDEPFTDEPTETADRWLQSGYKPVAHYASALADHDTMIGSAMDRSGSLATSGWSLHQLPLDPGEGRTSEGVWREAMAELHRISSVAFTEVYGHAPLPIEAFQRHMAPYRKNVDPRLVQIARAPNGEVAGFLLALPDVAQPRRHWFLVSKLAVLPKYRQLSLGAWLVAASHRAAQRAGYSAGVHCLMWTRTNVTDVSRHGARIFRRYALLEK